MYRIKSNKVVKNIYALVILSLVVITILISNYLLFIHRTNQKYRKKYNSGSQIALRKFPYPFRAAMTISNDIDNTETLEEFLEIHKFINTRKMTRMGEGIGLEIGNSFFFYEPPTGAISYFLGGPEVAQTIIRFIQAGYIDTLHSFGKKSDFTREDAITALQELNTNNCRVEVWVDHSKTKDNLGDDLTFGLGDHPGSKEYHADLTLALGIKFAWLGRVTMITGQSVPITIETFTDIFDSDHPMHSFVNISKEFAKNVLSVFGNKKYTMHKENDLVKLTELNDGQKVYEFMRFDNHWKGVGVGADSKGLAYSISSKVIAQLKKKEGYMIVYTHLGKNANTSRPIPKETRDALRNLAEEFKAGNIYITSTSKLLNYYVNHKYLNWSYKSQGDEITIHIHYIKDPIAGDLVPTMKDLQGITFYVPDKTKTRIFLSGKEIEDFQRNSPDYTGRESVTIPLTYFGNLFKNNLN